MIRGGDGITRLLLTLLLLPLSTLLLPPSTTTALAQAPPFGSTFAAGGSPTLTAGLPSSPTLGAGFRASIAVEPIRQARYRRVVVRLAAPGGFPADRRLQVHVRPLPNGYSPPGNGIRCVLPVAIDQGTKAVTLERMLPTASVGNGLRIEIHEDGRALEGYRADLGNLVPNVPRLVQSVIETESEPQLLWVFDEDRAASLPRRGGAESAAFWFGWHDELTMAADRLKGVEGTQLIEPATGEVPSHLDLSALSRDDWRNYQRFDVVAMEADTLRRLSGEFPEAWSVLRDWILIGGTLIVAGADDPASRMPQRPIADAQPEPAELEVLERSLVMAIHALRLRVASLQSSSAGGSGGGPSIAITAGSGRASRLPTSASQGATGATSQQETEELWVWVSKGCREREPFATTQRIGRYQLWSRPAGAGRVLGVPAAKGDASVACVDWRVARLLVEADPRRSLTLRRGLDPLLGDDRFNRWLIPGVAEPPVYTFMGLLTAFVILVGPVAYRQTTRRGRGYLMFAIAPALALLTTVALLLYGIVSDGFGTVARVRQLTWVDGASGDAAERVRATYFAGIRPASGLGFPAQAEVLPYPDYDGRSWQQQENDSPNLLGTVTVSEQGQRFSASFLPSRQQRQFVTHRPRRQLGRLTLLPDAASAPGTGSLDTVQVRSSFGFELREVVLCDVDGEFWAAASVPAGAEAVDCRPIDGLAVSKLLGDLYNRHRLVGAGGRRRTPPNMSWRTIDLPNVISSTIRQSGMATVGVFESWLMQRMQLDGRLPPGTFVAVADPSPEAVAVENAELVESVRFVFGTLP